MPVIPVITAVWSVGAASTAGFATLTAFQVIGVVSSVVGAVGAVTGNKTLQKIGMIGSLVGGVGAFAQSKGWLGLDASKGAEFNKAFTSGDLFNKKAPTATPSINLGTTPIEKVTGAPLKTADATLPAGTPDNAAGTPVNAAGNLSPPLTAVQQLAEQKAATAIANASGANGMWGSFQNFAATNPVLAFTGVTTIGSAVEGLFNEKASLEAEALKQQQLNMREPLPELRYARNPMGSPMVAQNPVGYAINPVTGKIMPPTPVAPGLINTVTGVPA